MRKTIYLTMGLNVVGNGRIDNGDLVVRLPADLPADFRGEITIEFEEACGSCGKQPMFCLCPGRKCDGDGFTLDIDFGDDLPDATPVAA